MSFTVAIVPEDDRLDRYVLKPLVEAACAQIGRPKARVRVVDNPAPRGVSTVLQREYLERVISRYAIVDVIVYCVDRDGDPGRDTALHDLVHSIESPRAGLKLGGVTAHQEVEVWCLATRRRNLDVPWDDVRAEPHPKERFFDPLVDQLSLTHTPGRGRKLLGEEAGRRYAFVREACPELRELEAILAI